MTEAAESKAVRRRLPQVDKVLRHPSVTALADSFSHEVLAELTRRQLDHLRASLDSESKSSGPQKEEKSDSDLLEEVALAVVARAMRLKEGGLKRVVNGTGVILNTNLGRAPLPESAAQRVFDVLTGYANLEIKLETGKRGERGATIDELLSVLTGCEAGLTVNNNAAAVMLAVAALAKNKEVIVSRGELIEIGGSFRLPDVIVQAGGVLKEVGTTNRTRIEDYKQAINADTGLIMRCHRSNFEIVGFTEQPSLAELVELSNETGIPFAEDLGSGALIDLERLGLDHEPTVREVVKAGPGLVMFSADKLLGGSQAGVIVGRKELIDKLRKNPIYRALRADKLSIALVEQVLACYLANQPEKVVPTVHMAAAPLSEIQERADRFCERAAAQLGIISLETAETTATFGGGTLPGVTIPSCAVRVLVRDRTGDEASHLSADKLSTLLRASEPPVVPFVEDEQVLIDFRTVSARDECLLLESLKNLDEKLKTSRQPRQF